MLENEIKIVVSQNKFGYLGVDLYANSRRIGLSNSLSKFEKTWLNNRRERLEIDVVAKEFKGQLYDIVVIRDTQGYDDEYVVLKLDYEVKELLIALICCSKIA